MRVSVLVPVFKVESYIERCARSLFEQTYPKLEYVFVNDCTPDRSMEVLLKVMNDYPERRDAVKIVNHEKNRGLAATRNTTLEYATGSFVIVVDSDDWLERNAIELLMNKQMMNHADLVSGNRIVHYQNEDSVLQERKYQGKEEMVLQMMQRSWDHFITGRLIRRSLFVEYSLRFLEGFNLGEDRYMMTLLAYYAKGIDIVDDVVYHYEHRNSDSITCCMDEKVIMYNAQELGNVLLLERFFADKDVVYRRECIRVVMEQLENNMKKTLAYSSKDGFYEIVGVIDCRSDDDQRMIGWKKTGAKGWFLHNYRWMRLNWLKEKTIKFVKKKAKPLLAAEYIF